MIRFRHYVLPALLCAFAAVAVFLWDSAEARETTLAYELPVEYCDGRALPLDEIQTLEIYVSAAPIPAADVDCASTAAEVDTPPDSFSELIQTGDPTGSVTIDLFPGPYFARGRVQTVDGDWSNFSGQVDLQVPGPGRPPVILRWNLGG